MREVLLSGRTVSFNRSAQWVLMLEEVCLSSYLPGRLYYADSHLTQFEARVVEWLTWEGQPAVVLDRTAFYPTSGGHPSDRGILCDVPVVSVEVRETDGTVIHRQVAAWLECGLKVDQELP